MIKEEIEKIIWNNLKPSCNQQKCLIKQFFENEAKKPAWLRSNGCLISCPCDNCSPRM